MRSLGVRLALSFAAVILVGVGGVALLAGRETASEFRTYVERGRADLRRAPRGQRDAVLPPPRRLVRRRPAAAGLDARRHRAPDHRRSERDRRRRLGRARRRAGCCRERPRAGHAAPGRRPPDRHPVHPRRRPVRARPAGRRGRGRRGARDGPARGRTGATAGRRGRTRRARTPASMPTHARERGRPVERASQRPARRADGQRRERRGATGRSPRRATPAGTRGRVPRAASRGPSPRAARARRRGRRARRRPSRHRPAPASGSAEAGFLDRVSRALLLSALGAAALALLLSLLLTRYLARPLRELATAARRVATGDLAQRVPIRSRDEVGALAAAFNEMAASLERGEAARRNLVADVAHELKTPLTVVEGTVEAMLDGVYPADRERLESIREEVTLLAKLVADLRELSLADAGGLRLEREPLDPAALVRRAAAAASARAEARGLDARRRAVRRPAARGRGRGPPGAGAGQPPGQRAALHAGRRARDGERGRRPGRARRRDERRAPGRHGYRLGHPRRRPAARLRPLLPRRPVTRPPQRRSGLGLAIARGYVEAHGGRIWAESASGRGTTVAFWLPALGGAADAASQPSRPGTAPPSPRARI